MKNLAFVLILLVALISPLHVRAQQVVSTATPLPKVTATPALTLIPSLTPRATATSTTTPILSATPTVTSTLSATPTETSSLTLTEAATATMIISPGVTAAPSITPEPTLTPTQTWLPSLTPEIPATQMPASDPPTASLSSRASLDSGLNPTIASAVLVDPSGQMIATTPFSPDGAFTLTAAAGNYILRLSAPGYLAVQRPVTLVAEQPIELAAASLPAGDINGDNRIDALDLISLGAAYETAFPQLSTDDLNGDGYVDLFDLTLLARNWRKTGPITW